jgi:molybdopterin-guanine dinucleotide biosynthesis protein A
MLRKLSCNILAGGSSSRFGSYKALALLNNKFLIVHIIAKLIPIISDIVITVSNDEQEKMLKSAVKEFNVRVVIDKPLGIRAAIVGFYTGLIESRNEYVLQVACDMPNISVKCIEYMYRKSINNKYDAVIPKWNNHIEPLHAIYNRERTIKAVEEALYLDKRLDFRAVIDKIDRKIFIPIGGKCPKESFYNINYKHELPN